MSFEKIELGEYIKVQGGYAYKSDDFNDDGDFPVIKIKNVRFGEVDYSEASYISSELADETIDWKTNEGDILISMTGSGPNAPNSLVGRVARIWEGEPDGWINQRVGRICVNEEIEIHPDFIFYLLSSFDTQYYLVSNSTGSANQANISGKLIESVPCPRVDYETSERIADQLRVLDQKIHLNQQTNETLEAMAQAIFNSWFVDFDPVRAKIEAKFAGRNPNRAAMAAIAGISSFAKASEDKSLEMNWDEMESALDQKLSSMTEEQRQQLIRTAQLFPDELVESEIGEVPKGWEVNSFKEICEDIQSGGTPKRSEPEYWGEGYPWLSSGEIRNRYLLSSEEQITEKGLTESNAKLWPSGSTIIAMYGATAGVTAYLAKEMCANQACCCLIPADNSVFVFISALRASRELSGKSTGSAQQNLNKGIIERHKILVPSDDIIEAFERIASHLIEKIISNEEQNDSLSELRDTLLPKLISGDVGV